MRHCRALFSLNVCPAILVPVREFLCRKNCTIKSTDYDVLIDSNRTYVPLIRALLKNTSKMVSLKSLNTLRNDLAKSLYSGRFVREEYHRLMLNRIKEKKAIPNSSTKETHSDRLKFFVILRSKYNFACNLKFSFKPNASDKGMI